MPKPTPAEMHAQESIGALLHRRSNLRQEKQMLLKAQDRIKEIDAVLELIDGDLRRYGHEEPETP